VIVNVNEDENRPPVAGDDFETTEEDTTATIEVLLNDSDPDSDPLTVTGVDSNNGPSNGEVKLNADGKRFDYTPNPDFNGVDSFVYHISDGNGGKDSALGERSAAGWSDGLGTSFFEG